jgi:hypothetical protein
LCALCASADAMNFSVAEPVAEPVAELVAEPPIVPDEGADEPAEGDAKGVGIVDTGSPFVLRRGAMVVAGWSKFCRVVHVLPGVPSARSYRSIVARIADEETCRNGVPAMVAPTARRLAHGE